MENARGSRLGEKEIRGTGEKKRNGVEREEEERNLLPAAHLANDTPSHNHRTVEMHRFSLSLSP